ncbi:MAG: tripartite tricarboxylate transporter substrate binding protein [Betaproteobacteria bacterium]|nr:tripartite tricarboxylate transporter substrate binding protein [Betaproteobacteria bacterium]
MTRVRWAACGAALGIALASHAQDYPNRTVRIIVPFPPGGGTDIVARATAQKLGEALGQTFIVDNRAGAGGTIGSEAAARAPADGYTLSMAASSTHGAAPSLYPKLGYDPLRDFAPISLIATTPFVLVVHPALPVKTVADFIALAKAQPGKLDYGSAGTGSSNHLTVEMFDMMAGVKTTHVPYKGSGPALVALRGGQIDFMINDMSSLITHVKAGKLRAIAVSSNMRNPRLDVPTIAETIPGYQAEAWYGLLAPAGTSEAIVGKLHQALVNALKATDLADRLKAQGLDPVGGTAQEFRDYMEREIKRWSKVVQTAGVKLE